MQDHNDKTSGEPMDVYDRVLAAKERIEREGYNWQALRNLGDGVLSAQIVCHGLSKTAGWWDGVNPQNPETFGTKIALIHSEISEAMEGGRKGTMDAHLPHRKTEEVELADAMIRILDLAGARNLDVAGAMLEKLAYNLERADHKREARAADGGKKF